MEGLPETIQLSATSSNATCIASLVQLTRDLAQIKIDATWWALPGVSKTLRQQENDHTWQWAKRIGELRNNRWHEAVAVTTEDTEVQGAILYQFNATSFVDASKPAVFVEALATAPRNRPWLVGHANYSGIGTGLLFRAVCHSYLQGYEGRVNLMAFDDSRTLAFYEHRGFEVVGHEEGLPLLELSQETAYTWLRKDGYEV